MRRLTLGLLVAFLALPALAADHDSAYYKRTGTKAPASAGDFLLGPSFHYSEQASAGISFGYAWKGTGIVLLGDYSAMRIDGVSGTTPFRCFQVPYQVDGYTRGQVGISLLVPIKNFGKYAR
jgi:hypothetical protein